MVDLNHPDDPRPVQKLKGAARQKVRPPETTGRVPVLPGAGGHPISSATAATRLTTRLAAAVGAGAIAVAATVPETRVTQ